MTSTLSPASAGSDAGWLAGITLGYTAEGGRTVLTRRMHVGPLRVQKPLYPEGGDICHTLLLHPPGGIAGGDRLQMDIAAGHGTHALITTPGAAKWYRSAGSQARADLALTVATGAVVEWLPQESIVFNGARAHSAAKIDVEAGGLFIGMDLWCLGRTASGERFASGTLALDTRIRLDGRTRWLEQARLEGDGPLLGSTAGLAGAPVFGSLIAAGCDADDALLAGCRAAPAPAAAACGITRMPGMLIARYRGGCTQEARAWFVHLWALIRPSMTGRPAHTPRIWNT